MWPPNQGRGLGHNCCLILNHELTLSASHRLATPELGASRLWSTCQSSVAPDSLEIL